MITPKMDTIEKEEEIFLDEKDIINQDYLNTIKTDVGIICGICQSIIINPFSCDKCQNCFCMQCIKKWLKNHNDCPFRCANAKIAENRVMKNVLSIFKFKCKNGCNEEISYSNIIEHYKSKCEKLDYKTKYEKLLIEFEKVRAENSKLKQEIENLRRGGSSTYNNSNQGNNNTFKSRHHEHILVKGGRRTEGRCLSWSCNICLNSPSGDSYYCFYCRFDLCETCKRKEEN